MTTSIRAISAGLLLALIFAAPQPILADELTERVQKDLVALGYDPGNISGEMTADTEVAIAKYQAEHDMPVTGEVSPILAGILSAEVDRQRNGGAAGAAAPAAAPQADPAALAAAQQACLQQKIDAQQQAQKKKQGFGRLLGAVTRTAARHGNYDVARTASDIYSANATAADLATAAEELGLTQEEVAACQNPLSQ